jgi:hypothetical protein
MEREFIHTPIAEGFEKAQETFEAEVTALFDIDGFDADGLTDIYPEILDINSNEGARQRKRWTYVTENLAAEPLLTLVARLDTENIEWDARDPMQGVKNRWVHVYSSLKPSAFIFQRATDDEPARIEIHAPTIALKDFPTVDIVLFDIRSQPSIRKIEELESEPHIKFADGWSDLYRKAEDIDSAYRVSGFGGISDALLRRPKDIPNEPVDQLKTTL